MLSAEKKGKLLLAGILLGLIVILGIVIANGAYQNSPGTLVNYDTLPSFAGKKVTIQGTLGEIASTVTVNEGGDPLDYFNEYLFYPNLEKPTEFIYLRYKPSNFRSVQAGDRITVTGQAILENDKIYIEVIKLNKN